MRVTLEKCAEEQIIELLHQPGGYDALGHLIQINPQKLTPAGRIDFLAALEPVDDLDLDAVLGSNRAEQRSRVGVTPALRRMRSSQNPVVIVDFVNVIDFHWLSPL